MSMSYDTLQLPLERTPMKSERYDTRPLPLLRDDGRGVSLAVSPSPFAALATRVSNHIGPERLLELAALLEAEGVTDVVATQYGASDVFDLAQRLLAGQSASAVHVTRPAPRSEATPPRLLPSLLHGPLTLAIMVVLLAALKYYEAVLRHRGAPTWTTLLGLTTGMVIAGAIMQALGWRISVASSQATPQAMRPVLLLGLGFGLATAVIAGLGLAALGQALHLSFAGLVGLAESCTGLVALLILCGGLALLDRGWLALTALILCFGGMWMVGLHWPGTDPLLTQIVPGLTLALLLLAGSLAYTVHRRTNGDWSSIGSYLPPFGQLLYHATPYLCYGGLTVMYVLIGQTIGWYAQLPSGWTRSEAVVAVEIAHLIGLTALVLNQGIVEYALRSFWHTIRSAQRQVILGDGYGSRTALRRFLRRSTMMLLVGQSVVGLGLVALAIWLWPAAGLTPLLGPIVPSVLLVSLSGYGFLAWGLLGCSILVMLAHPWQAVGTLLIAMVVQLTSSLILSRLSTIEMASLSSVIGGAALVLLTHVSITCRLRQSDYELYQAF